MSEERQKQIHEMGFNFFGERKIDGPMTSEEAYQKYGNIKVGTKVLEDATLELGSYNKVCKHLANKHEVMRALHQQDLSKLIEISEFFYRTSGIYSRVCNYFAYLYRYDWFVVPEIFDKSAKEEKVLTDFNKLLSYLDNTHIKKLCGDIALKVIIRGAYYGYLIEGENSLLIQELPLKYCRTRYYSNGVPVVEFNMKYFDDAFNDVQYRLRVVKMFPKEFQEGYLKYKQGKLPPDYVGDTNGSWYVLTPGAVVKFNFHNSDVPLFINAIPAILDLDAAQDLDRKKRMQQLLKVVIQKLPLDKNYDLIFDMEEARDIHNNAVQMLRHAIGVDVLTTFADVQVEDIADTSSDTTDNSLENAERTVYNSFGTAQNLFNTEGSTALQKSIQNDESVVRDLLFQFQAFFDTVAQKKGSGKKKYNFRLHMLETTQDNYKDLSKMYKEQVQIGYSKMLPQIALGHSQSSIIHTAHFENEVLHLSELMIPPLMSSTLSSEDIAAMRSGSKNGDAGEAGRPELPDDQKSDKTIANKEAIG